jgi:hypothetical protein
MPDLTYPASEGYTTTTVAAAKLLLQDMFRLHARAFGYDAEGRWEACDLFAILRLRGVCHTVYVVHQTSDDNTEWAYRVVDMWTDGGPHTCAEISDPITSWGDALLTATRKVVLDDTEIAETLTAAQAAALRATDRESSLTVTYED